MDRFIQFVGALDTWGWIAIIVISGLVVEGVVKVKRMQIKHTERMAKIERGVDPGDEVEAYKKDEV